MPQDNSPAANGAQEDDIALTQADRADQAFLNKDDGNEPSETANTSPDVDLSDQTKTEDQDPKEDLELATDSRLEHLNRIAKKRKDDVADQDDELELVADTLEENDSSDKDEDADPEVDQHEQPKKRKIRLKVDKREIDMDEDEVIAAAQQYLANERRGDRDSGALDRLANKLDEITSKQEAQDSTTEPEAMATTPADGDLVTDDMRELVEKIQTGDVDEGAQALIEILGNRDSPSTEDVQRTVQDVLTQNSQKQQLQEAFRTFETEEPELAKSSDARDLIAINMMRKMADEFLSIGVDPEELKPYRNNASEMYRLHRTYNEMGHGDKLTPIPELLMQTGKRVKPLFAPNPTPNPTEESQDSFADTRDKRKRALSSQPSNAGTSRTSRRRPTQQARPSRGDVIKEMARMRNPS